MNDVELFLRFAEGCRCYLKDVGILSPEDEAEIASGKPSQDTVRRVFYMAYPYLEKLSQKLGRPMFDRGVLRRFYCFEHNRLKHEQGHLACMTFPGRIIGGINNEYIIELEPIDTALRAGSELDLRPRDWVLVHRMSIVEKITSQFAKRVTDYLKKLGMNKHLKFPSETIKYLKELQERNE